MDSLSRTALLGLSAGLVAIGVGLTSLGAPVRAATPPPPFVFEPLKPPIVCPPPVRRIFKSRGCARCHSTEGSRNLDRSRRATFVRKSHVDEDDREAILEALEARHAPHLESADKYFRSMGWRDLARFLDHMFDPQDDYVGYR